MEKEDIVEPDRIEYKNPYSGGSTKPDDVASLRYRTEVFKEDVEVTGPIVLHLFAAIDKEDANFTVLLNDVPAQGRPKNLSTGNLRAAHRSDSERELKPWETNNNHYKRPPL